jgi:RHS repeat-associated protein
VRKDDSTGTAKAVWDAHNILLETDQNDITLVIYTIEPLLHGNLITQFRGSATRYYQFDDLGSTAQLTDSSGQTITDSYLYKGFGELLASTGTTVNPFRYVGRVGYYYDTDQSLIYLRARYYDPFKGRFLSRDLPSTDEINLYRYVKNKPVELADPSGLGRFTIPYFCEILIACCHGSCTCNAPRGILSAVLGAAMLLIEGSCCTESCIYGSFRGGFAQPGSMMGCMQKALRFGFGPRVTCRCT